MYPVPFTTCLVNYIIKLAVCNICPTDKTQLQERKRRKSERLARSHLMLKRKMKRRRSSPGKSPFNQLLYVLKADVSILYTCACPLILGHGIESKKLSNSFLHDNIHDLNCLFCQIFLRSLKTGRRRRLVRTPRWTPPFYRTERERLRSWRK